VFLQQDRRQRGLGGPNVKSGIRRSGRSRYAEKFQRDLGAETQNIQDDLNTGRKIIQIKI
jgi:hypothetical protein